MSPLAILLLRFYHWGLSPFLGPRCRFTPSCSVYAQEAISRFGFWNGLFRGMWRLARCHPFSSGGYDPVKPGA